MKPCFERDGIRLYQGHVLDVLRALPDESVQCCVTSPPYFGLRDYGTEPQVWGNFEGCQHEWGECLPPHHPGQVEQTKWKTAEAAGKGQTAHSGQFCVRCNAWLGSLGLEPTPDLFVAHLVEVFREVRRVLRSDGMLWLNCGDSYASGKGSCFNPGGGENSLGKSRKEAGAHPLHRGNKSTLEAHGLKPKDLIGVPWMLAFALRADGWWLRSEITGCKVACMPESVTDRPTSATEKVFLFAKAERYYYDNIAVAEPAIHEGRVVKAYKQGAKNLDGATDANDRRTAAGFGNHDTLVTTRNLRNWFLWHPEPFPGAHFAVFPRKIPEMAILAGSSARGACARCGAPWERVVERTSVVPVDYEGEWSDADPQSSGRRMLANVRARRQSGEPHDNPFPPKATIGWTPTCDCDCPDVVPCVCLDPFAGSGTTLAVAQSLGRHAIGIDLNPEYCRLAVDRLPQQAMVLEV